MIVLGSVNSNYNFQHSLLLLTWKHHCKKPVLPAWQLFWTCMGSQYEFYILKRNRKGLAWMSKRYIQDYTVFYGSDQMKLFHIVGTDEICYIQKYTPKKEISVLQCQCLTVNVICLFGNDAFRGGHIHHIKNVNSLVLFTSSEVKNVWQIQAHDLWHLRNCWYSWQFCYVSTVFLCLHCL